MREHPQREGRLAQRPPELHFELQRHPAAASSESGTARFEPFENSRVITEANSPRSGRHQNVQAYSVDDLAAAYRCRLAHTLTWRLERRSARRSLENLLEKKPDWSEAHRGAGLEERGGRRSCPIVFRRRYRCYVAKQATANDYAHWHGFELLKESDLPIERFYLVAIAE